MVGSSTPAEQNTIVDVTCPIFLETMQKMVGGGISAAKSQYCPASKVNSSSATNLFETLVFRDDGSVTIPSDYMQYYPNGLQHCNTGGLHLIPPNLIPWAIELFRFIVNSYRKGNIVENRREYIAVSLNKLRKDDTIFKAFKQVIQGTNTSIDDRLLSKVHSRIAEYAFRAFTKQKNNAEFNQIKAVASDKSNLNFRTVVQTGGHDAKGGTGVNKKQAASKNAVAKDLGMKPAQKRAPKKQEEDVRKSYQEPYSKAIEILGRDDDTDPVKAKLSKDQCAAILTIGFDIFTRVSNKKVGDLRDEAKKAIDGDYTDKTRPNFFSRMDQEKKKRKDGGGKDGDLKEDGKKGGKKKAKGGGRKPKDGKSNTGGGKKGGERVKERGK